MISLRSWYFVISLLLVRCRSAPVALESMIARECEGSDCSSSGSSFVEVTKLFRRDGRASQEQDSTIIAILVGCSIGLLTIMLFLLVIFMLVRRQQIHDIEKRLISVDGEPQSQPSSRRSSWAQKLRFARHKLWLSAADEKPQVLFDDASGMTDSKGSLPFYEIQKPAAVLNQSSLDRESNIPYAVSLATEAHLTPLDLYYRDIDSVSSHSHSSCSTAQESQMTAAPSKAVAQTIIKPKPRVHFAAPTSPERTRPRKASLLSNPPLVVRKLPSLPAEEDLPGVNVDMLSSEERRS